MGVLSDSHLWEFFFLNDDGAMYRKGVRAENKDKQIEILGLKLLLSSL